MIRVDRILVVIDPTANVHPAFDKALTIAKCCASSMELFACDTNHSREARSATHLAAGRREEFIGSVATLVEPLAAAARQQGIDTSVATDSGEPLYAKLLERMRRTSADLVVKDTHHHSLARRTLLTHTDWELIRGCPVPLLLTRPPRWRDPPVIAAAVDPGQVNDKPDTLDRRLIEAAHMLATRLDGSMQLLHAYIPSPIAADTTTGSPFVVAVLDEQRLEQLRALRQKDVEVLAQAFGVAESSVHVQLGVASDVLPRLAQETGVDILAMGAISRHGLQRLFIGSTAERVLDHISCDVLIVKPLDFSAVLPF